MKFHFTYGYHVGTMYGEYNCFSKEVSGIYYVIRPENMAIDKIVVVGEVWGMAETMAKSFTSNLYDVFMLFIYLSVTYCIYACYLYIYNI